MGPHIRRIRENPIAPEFREYCEFCGEVAEQG
jgi:hypothetical protein